MVVYVRHILYIYSHFPCLKVFFKGRCSFLLLFLNLWGTWMTRILPPGIDNSAFGTVLMGCFSWNQFLWNSLDDLPWSLVIYHDFSWWKIHVFLWKKMQFLNSLEGRFFGFFCWRMFCTVKTPSGVVWCKERPQLAAVSYDRRPIKFSTEVLIYLYIYEWYIHTNLHIYTCGDIIWCEWEKQFMCLKYQKCNQLPFCSVWFRTHIQPGSMCKWCMGFVCRIPSHEYKTTWCTGGSPLQLFDVHIITCTCDCIHTLTLYNDKPRPLSDTTNCFNEGVKMMRCLVAWEDEKMKIATFGCLRFEMVIYSNCFSFPPQLLRSLCLAMAMHPRRMWKVRIDCQGMSRDWNDMIFLMLLVVECPFLRVNSQILQIVKFSHIMFSFSTFAFGNIIFIAVDACSMNRLQSRLPRFMGQCVAILLSVKVLDFSTLAWDVLIFPRLWETFFSFHMFHL